MAVPHRQTIKTTTAMEITTIEEIKKNSRIDSSYEDDVIEQIGETAEAMVQAVMERPFSDLAEEYGTIPAPVKRATLCLADHLYTQRAVVSGQAMYSVPYTIDFMLKPYCRLVLDKNKCCNK